MSNEELESLGQMKVKQLKNRYNDPAINRAFIVGVDRSKMRLYDVENVAQNIVDKNKQKKKKIILHQSRRMKSFQTLNYRRKYGKICYILKTQIHLMRVIN